MTSLTEPSGIFNLCRSFLLSEKAEEKGKDCRTWMTKGSCPKSEKGSFHSLFSGDVLMNFRSSGRVAT